MTPKIGYLINNNDEWDDVNMYSDWQFYTEENVPEYKIRYPSKQVRRIVYWEIGNGPV